MVRMRDLKQTWLEVGVTGVTVQGAIPINSIRDIYRLKAINLQAGENKLYITHLLGATVSATVDVLRFSSKGEVQDWPNGEFTEKSLPLWSFEEALCDHVRFAAFAASVEVFLKYIDEHA